MFMNWLWKKKPVNPPQMTNRTTLTEGLTLDFPDLDEGPLGYEASMRDLGKRGIEVSIIVINNSDNPAQIGDLKVVYEIDGVTQKEAQLALWDCKRLPLDLRQFEYLQGHYHIEPPRKGQQVHLRLLANYRHCGRVSTGKISRRMVLAATGG